jgi:hypothetical protein
MRTIAIMSLAVAVTGCSGGPPARDGTIGAIIQDTQRPGDRQAAWRTIDDAKCRDFGFKPGTDAYGNCRLQLEQMRVPKSAVEVAPATAR